MKSGSFTSCGGVLVLLATVTLLVQGCLIIPVPAPHRAEGSREAIEDDRAQVLRAGVTTREEVLLALGEPEDVLDGERVFVYRWARALTSIIVVGYYAGTKPSVTSRHDLRIEFDDQGRLKGVERSARECRGWVIAAQGECR